MQKSYIPIIGLSAIATVLTLLLLPSKPLNEDTWIDKSTEYKIAIRKLSPIRDLDVIGWLDEATLLLVNKSQVYTLETDTLNLDMVYELPLNYTFVSNQFACSQDRTWHFKLAQSNNVLELKIPMNSNSVGKFPH